MLLLLKCLYLTVWEKSRGLTELEYLRADHRNKLFISDMVIFGNSMYKVKKLADQINESQIYLNTWRIAYEKSHLMPLTFLKDQNKVKYNSIKNMS